MDSTEIENGICLCHTSDEERFSHYQKIYGTANVIYAPDRLYLESVEPSSMTDTISVVYNSQSDTENIKRDMKRLIRHLKVRHDEVIETDESDLEAIRKSKLVILVHASKEMCVTVLKSMIVFCCVNPIFGLYINHLKDLGLDKVCIRYEESEIDTTTLELQTDRDRSSSYNQLKLSFSEVYQNIGYIEETLSVSIPRMRRLDIYVKHYLDMGSNIPYTKPSTGYNDSIFYISPNVRVMGLPSNSSGMYLDPHIHTTFIDPESSIPLPHLYPWVGILETSCKYAIQSLFRSPLFISSLSLCKGIFVYDHITLSRLDARLSDTKCAGHVRTRTLSLCAYPSKYDTYISKFDVDVFLNNPNVINIDGNSPIILSIRTGQIGTSPNLPCIIGAVAGHTFIGPIIYAIRNCIPIILTKSDVSKELLGEGYPLYTESTDSDTIISIFNRSSKDQMMDILLQSIEILSQVREKLISPEQMIDQIRSSDIFFLDDV